MIIQGLIETNQGPVDVSKLEVGDCVLNQMHRAHPVTAVEKTEVEGGFTFKKNKALIVAKRTSVRTLYGTLPLTGNKKLAVTMVQPNMREIRDVAIPVKGTFTAYKITVDNSEEVFASNYCVETEKSHD